VLGLGLVLLATSGVSLAIRQQIPVAQAHIAADARPIVAVPAAPGPHLVTAPAPQPDSGRELQASVEPSVTENPSPAPPPRFDLDYGHPMSPEVRDTRDTKNTY
jgi:hypothetical protein